MPAFKHAGTGRLFSCWCLYSPFSGDFVLISGTSFSARFAGKVRIYACKPAYRPRLVFIFVNNGTGIVQWFLLVTPNLTTIPACIGRFFLLLLLLHWFFFFSGDGGTITSNPSICKACRSIRKTILNHESCGMFEFHWKGRVTIIHVVMAITQGKYYDKRWEMKETKTSTKTQSGQQDQLPMLAQLASIAKHPSSQEIGDPLIPYHDCIPLDGMIASFFGASLWLFLEAMAITALLSLFVLTRTLYLKHIFSSNLLPPLGASISTY